MSASVSRKSGSIWMRRFLRTSLQYRVRPIADRQWAVANEPGGAEVRVTCDRDLYSANTDDCELWTPGSSVFPPLDAPRSDVRSGDYPANLRAFIG